MVDLNYFNVKKNIDSLFFLSTNKNYFYQNIKKHINVYNKQFNIERSINLKSFKDQFNFLSFDGVNEAQVLETSSLHIVVWKHKNENVPISLDEAKIQLAKSEIDAFLIFDKNQNTFYWANHFLSKVNIYYSLNNGNLLLSNDLNLINKNKSMLAGAEEVFKTLGWVPPEMQVYEGVCSSDPKKVYSYSLDKKNIEIESVINITGMFNSSFESKPSTQEFYKIFKESIKTKVSGNSFVLTGGCDTRLILSALENSDEMLFWADNTQERKDIYFDSCIFRHILKDNNLKGFLLDNKKSGKESFEPINLSYQDWNEIAPFFNDHPCSVSGMFGGELLGGAYLDNISGSKTLIDSKLSPEIIQLLERYPEILFPYFLAENSPLKQAYFMRLFFKTPLSEFYYPHNVWKTPVRHCRLFTQKPFLNKDILIYIANIAPSELQSHKFYMQVYKDCASSWLKYPFQNLGVTMHDEFKSPEGFYSTEHCNFQPKLNEKNPLVRRGSLLAK